MNHFILCTLRMLGMLAVVYSSTTMSAQAISWEWVNLEDRERITVTFDNPQQASRAVRVAPQKLEVALGDQSSGLILLSKAPQPGSLVTGVSITDNKLYIDLKDAAFGFLSSSPKPAELVVDIYPDILGNRWNKLGVPAPENAASRSPSALPDVDKGATVVPVVKEPMKKDPPKNEPANNSAITKEKNQPEEQGTALKIVENNTEKETDPAIKPTTANVVEPSSFELKKGEDSSQIIPPPSVDELTKITLKVDEVFPQDGEFTWTEEKKSNTLNALTDDVEENIGIENNEVQHSEISVEEVQTLPESSNVKESFDYSTITSLRGTINTQGKEAWPADQALATTDKLDEALALLDAPSTDIETRALLKKGDNNVEEEVNKQSEEVPVVYVDEQGNPVPKPLDVIAMLNEAKENLKKLQLESSKDLLIELKDQVLTPEQREEVLYLLSEVNEKIYTKNWVEGYEPIVKSTSEAMNFNLSSPRVAEALLRLGMINLVTGNQDEAAGYFGALRNKFPQNPFNSEAFLALGKDQFAQGQYGAAVKTFKTVMDEYPESQSVRDAARFMAEALFKQGHYDRALILVDFVDRRWPRLYLEDPGYLIMVGDLYLRENRLDDALKYYLTYYNLLSQAENNHEVLYKMGVSYLGLGLLKAAKDTFDELLKKYPKSPSAPKALLVLGEEKIMDDNPSIEDLFTVFESPSATIPEIYYKRILEEYPSSPEAQKSLLRLAAWKLLNRDIPLAMKTAQDFLEKYPSSVYSARAEEILMRGFEQIFALALQEENYDRILSTWEKYPYLQIAYKDMEDDLRVSLARAYLNRGNEDKGMDMLEIFLESPQDPNYGDYVYNLYLARYLRKEDWGKILDFGEKVSTWKMPISARLQLDYAMAIAAENLGLGNKALPIWEKLHKREDIPLYQKAYATYFMARDAERRRDLNAAYKFNLDTLKLFNTLEEERSDKADPERIRESLAALMDVTEVANRFSESLEWADQYASFVPETSQDYAGFLFRKARLYRKIGDLTKWRQLLNEIVRREPESVFGRMAASELRTFDVSRDLKRFIEPQKEQNPKSQQ